MPKTKVYKLAEIAYIYNLFYTYTRTYRKREMTGIPFINNNKSYENI